jgi:chromosome segregation ATPase
LKICQEQTLSEINTQSVSETDFLKQQLDEMTAANSEISAENSRLWNEIQSLMTQIEKYRAEAESLIEKQSSSVDSNELKNAKEEMDQLRNSMETQILQKDQELEKTRIDLNILEGKLKSVEDQVPSNINISWMNLIRITFQRSKVSKMRRH